MSDLTEVSAAGVTAATPFLSDATDRGADPRERARPSLWEIASVFGLVALAGFGGGQKAQVRRQLVTVKRWLSDADYVEALEVSELLPGPNVLNLAIFIGQSLRGTPGALVAFLAGAMPPFAIVLIAGALYFSALDSAPVQAALRGAAAAGLGLTLANALELSARTHKRTDIWFIAATVIAVSYFKLSLLATLVILGALSMGCRAVAARSSGHPPP